MHRQLLTHLAILVVFPAGFAAAQGAVSGAVFDSIARAPLGGAKVQLVSAGTTARFGQSADADSLGRFAMSGIPDGRYTLGFFHPLLDSLGIEAPLREVTISGGKTVRADLSTPSPARLRHAFCPRTGTFSSGGVVVGVIRNANDGTPAAGVNVTGQWFEVTITKKGAVQNKAGLTATTGDNGWFALCDVPNGGAMWLVASRGADSTDYVGVQVPANGFLRRELYLGSARNLAAGDSLSLPRYVGTGRLSGTVRAAERGTPLTGALVGIVNGPQARVNEKGEWMLAEVPTGTRMMEVRAIGNYPERLAVNVISNAPPIDVKLTTLKNVLDTMRVVGKRVVNRDLQAFNERRRSGAGRYLTEEDIKRRGSIFTSQLFMSVGGVRYERLGVITMRSFFGLGRCFPNIFVNGLPSEFFGEMDSVYPDEIAGIEIYTGPFAPIEYQVQTKGAFPCGTVLIWKKKPL